MRLAQTVVIDIAARLQDRTSAGVEKVKSNVDKLGKSIEKMQKQMAKMKKSEISLAVKDKAMQSIEKISKTISSLSRKTWNVSVKILDKATAPLRGILNMLKNPILQAGTVLGISLGGANTFQTYQGFEKSMSNVKALSGANASDTAELTKLAREMGKTTTKSASEAADALGYMALAGWDKEIMQKSIKPVLRLSEAGNMDLGRTSDLVTDSMSSLGIDGRQEGALQSYLDKVAKTASSSNTNIDSMMEAFLEFGGTVKNNGIAHDEASALIGILANRGVKGSEAGTALNSVFVNLTKGGGEAGKAMEKLNLSAYDAQGNFKGYANVLKELHDKTKDLTDKQKAYYYSAIGGKTRMSELQHLLSGVSGEYDELKEKVANSNGALEEMANIMNDNIYGDVKALQSAVESVQLDFMDKFQPSARKFLQWSKDLTLSFGQKLTKAAEKFQYRIEKIENTIKEFKGSKEWQNADLSGKIGIAWDKIIAEPFVAWWSSEGKTWACGVANDIGYGISSALTAGISALLGIDLVEATDSGFDIGKSFAEGFINGFDGSKIWEGIKQKSKEIVVNASKILPGGEQATGGSWLSAGLLAYGGIKVGKALGAGKLFGRLGSGAAETVTSIAKAAKPVTQNADNYVDFWKNAKLWNTTTREVAIESYQTGWRAINSSVAKKSLGGISGVFDDIAVKIAPYVPKLKDSIGKAGKFLKGNGLSFLFSAAAVMQAENKKKETVVQGGSFATSLAGGSLGTKIGAAIGTAIAPGVGTAIGGAIGGLAGSIGGYTGGEKLFRKLTDNFKTEKEKQSESIQTNISNTQSIRSDLKHANDLIWETEHLRGIWKNLQKELSKTDLSEEDRLQKQQELNDIAERFVALYPDMISKEDIINGKIEERIEKIQKWNEAEKKLQAINLKQQNLENAKNFDKTNEDYVNSKKEIADLEKKEKHLTDIKGQIKDLFLDRDRLNKDLERLEKQGNKGSEEYQSLQKQRNEKNSEIRSTMYENGFMQGKGEGKYTMDSMDSAVGAIDFYMGKLYEEYAGALKKDSELERILTEWRNSELQQIEIDYGEPIEQAIQKYDEMDAAGKEALENAIRKVIELQNKYAELPDKITTELMFKIVYSGVQPENMIKRFQNPMGAGISMMFDKFTNQNVDKKAMGGIVNKPHFGVIGEAGAEVIIPLTGTNKHRGVSLWQQTGELLGMLPKHAQGGIFGGSIDYKSMFDEAENKQQTTQASSITISLGGMNFTFTGSGTSDKESIITTIRQQMPEIANEVAEAIAKELQKLLPNMKASVA